MLVSQDWLKEYVSLPDHDEMVDRLTMTGLNHEGSEAVGNDTCIDLEVTSNRADCLGHVGVAREVSALFTEPLRIPPAELNTAAPAIDQNFAVEIQCPELCYRFTARLIRGVKIGPSPQWLVDRLATVGVESVNNIVDISNYVMLECGQPLHAFDYDRLQGNKIIVREPHSGEKLEAINHNTYDLQPGMCVIADGNRAVGLGGVMGGAETEVSDNTVNVLIEAAHFNPLSIRATARKLNLHSAASFRFERTINSENIDWASRRCCELLQQLAGGEIADGFIDVGAKLEPRQPIRLRFAQLDRILGIEIPRDRAVEILESLGFARCLTKSIGGKAGSGGISLSVNTAEFSEQVKDQLLESDADEVTVIPPPWRLDVTREVDLI
ncbi:MAG: phenylalanine--tRNA ligase subunit beta, partial [Pirellulaceae bacterium]